MHPQFVDANNKLLPSGFLYTYQAGTTTLQATYIDSTGTIQNANPIPLEATAVPSTGSAQPGIWRANQSYNFCAYSAALVQQWCVDNVTGYLNLLNLANTWTFQQTFTQPIIDTQTDNQFVLGAGGNQTTLDFPPPTGNVTLHFPNITDTVIARTTTDTLTNKTLTSPTLNTPTVNGTQLTNTPGAYFTIANQNPTGTTISTLTKLVNAPSQAQIAAITDTGGVVGICVAGCGATSNATIQQSGQASCVFDGATTAGDYVQISATVAGNCHDGGSTYPLTGVVIGRTLSTNGGGGTYSMNLFGPEILPPSSVSRVQTTFADGTATTANASTTAQQLLKVSSAFAAGALNKLKASIRLTGQFHIVVGGGASNQALSWGVGNDALLSSGASTISMWTTAGNSTTIDTTGTLTCTVKVIGATGQFICSLNTFSNIGSFTFTQWTPTVDLTQSVFFGNECNFSVASASNTCTQNQLIVEQLN